MASEESAGELEQDERDEEVELEDEESDDEPEVDQAPPEPVSLRFTGSVREYFRVWLVNTFLSVVTLGVFSAWAKVRKKRYLYAHTLVDGTPLRYLGRPIPILKGRLLALLLLAIWYLVTRHYRGLLWPLLGLGVLVVPWMLVKTASFNARSTSFRNITFDFKGSYAQALGLGLGGLLLIGFSFGLAYPWFQYRLRHWLVTSTYYGRSQLRFTAKLGSFYRIYLAVWGTIALSCGVLWALFGPWFLLRVIGRFRDPELFVAIVYGCYLLATCCIYTLVTNRVWQHTWIGPLRFASKLRVRDMLWLYCSNAALVLGSLGLLVPWATLRMLRYRVSKLGLLLHGSLAELEGLPTSLPGAGGAEAADAFDLDLAI